MNWRKLGKIFDPDTHGLPAGCVGWAQSPQPLVLEDRVRIYFSTRMLDPVADGKYLSHVAYVDMTKDLETVLEDYARIPTSFYWLTGASSFAKLSLIWKSTTSWLLQKK